MLGVAVNDIAEMLAGGFVDEAAMRVLFRDPRRPAPEARAAPPPRAHPCRRREKRVVAAKLERLRAPVAAAPTICGLPPSGRVRRAPLAPPTNDSSFLRSPSATTTTVFASLPGTIEPAKPRCHLRRHWLAKKAVATVSP